MKGPATTRRVARCARPRAARVNARGANRSCAGSRRSRHDSGGVYGLGHGDVNEIALEECQMSFAIGDRDECCGPCGVAI